VTAGEAERPEESIPRAMRTIVFRLILFYVLAITVMLAMTPWNHAGTGITGSPFVSAFSAVGIPYGASIMNLVVITAALSSSNTDLYLSTRMLFSLSRGRYAPEWLGRLSENGVPRDRCEHVLCPGLAVLGSSFRANSSADFSRVLESPARESVCPRYGTPVTDWLRSAADLLVCSPLPFLKEGDSY